MITDKTLNINADTLSTGEMNVELKVINDDEVNDNRQFTLTIKSAEGAEVTTQTTIVSIVDDDKDPYFGFFGTWYLNGTTQSPTTGLPVNASMPVTVSGVTDTSDPAYNRKLTVESSSIISGLPISFTTEFNLNASDPTNMTGTIGIPYGQTVVSGVGTYDPVTGAEMTVDVSLVGVGATGIDNTGILKSDTWTIGSDGVVPTEVTFNQTTRILFGFNYVNTSVPDASGFYNFANYYGLSLTREPLY